MLGPLAVDVAGAGVEGLLLAGDAAGFIDPMTGDGLRLAMRGGELAAEAALESLEGGQRARCDWPAAVGRRCWCQLRVNRAAAMRSSPTPLGVSAPPLATRIVAGPAQRRSIGYAGDCRRA